MRRRAGALGCGLASGVLLGALPYLSYGLVPYLLVPAAMGVLLRVRPGVVVAVSAGAAAVTAAFAAGGFRWPAGVAATHAEWAADPGAARPYWYFLVANLAVLALLTGPAAAVGLARLVGPVTGTAWHTRATGPGAGFSTLPVLVLVGAALAAVLALDISGVTRGEVERIWVPYAVWLGLAAAWAAPDRATGRGWLAAQVVTGLLLQGLIMSPW